MKTSWAITLILLISTRVVFVDADELKVDKSRERLEKLFIWKVSDRLELSPTEEEKFSQKYTGWSNARKKFNSDLSIATDELSNSKGPLAQENALKKYKDSINGSHALQLKELDEIKTLFGNQKLAQYILLKKEMTEKFKDVLTQGSAVPTKTEGLKEPKVIQE